MQEDLTLFLNEKALTFSQWLHSVLAKLQKVTFGGTYFMLLLAISK